LIVLGIETSCDDTCVALVEDGRRVLSEVRHSQDDVHKIYGGVVPEIAAREHLLMIDKTIAECFKNAGIAFADIDRIAVVDGPGLVSSLLVGITAAKTLSWLLNKEIVNVHHLKAHVCAVNLSDDPPSPPFLCLLASGGHTQLLKVVSYSEILLLGETLDDSAGEAFDKVARMLGLNYPGGPEIESLARNGDPTKFELPRSKVVGRNFSFSGLKTAVMRLIDSLPVDFNKADLAASFQENVCVELVGKLIKTANEEELQKIVIAGGVASNGRFRQILKERSGEDFQFYFPALKHCTDNGAMVAAAGFLCPEGFGMNFDVFSRDKAN
jgi:N6-L-threonylcarbamoyladenine synthase